MSERRGMGERYQTGGHADEASSDAAISLRLSIAVNERRQPPK
jgi:hypothetical protein